VLFGVESIGINRRHTEEHTQDIFSFRGPSHGFDPQGIEGEDGRGEGGWPEGVCGFIQKEKQKNDGTDVEKQADQMMAKGIGAEQAPVQHMGEPGQRMPVTEICGCQSPLNAFFMDSRLNMNVFGNIFVIIVIDKIIGRNTAEDRAARDNQKYDNKVSIFFIHRDVIYHFL